MPLKDIEGYIKSHLCFKHNFFLNIFLVLNLVSSKLYLNDYILSKGHFPIYESTFFYLNFLDTLSMKLSENSNIMSAIIFKEIPFNLKGQ